MMRHLVFEIHVAIKWVNIHLSGVVTIIQSVVRCTHTVHSRGQL